MTDLTRLNPPTIKQIRQCKNVAQLEEWRVFLMENVTKLMVEKHMEWSVWEMMINHIDAILHDMPVTIDIAPMPGKHRRHRT